ncbi:hypothetical protein FRC09_020392 [Ceratobasidium sp. 395]|nr:hypothetical protein FRC09_020392 [Ceratobasidium sp. 395]
MSARRKSQPGPSLPSPDLVPGACFKLEPFSIQGDIRADEHGLIWFGFRRAAPDTIREEIRKCSPQPGGKKETKNTKYCKDWWRAQSAFFDLPTNNQKNIANLQTGLEEVLKIQGDIPAYLLALETAAKTQFREAKLSIQSFISAQGFTPPAPANSATADLVNATSAAPELPTLNTPIPHHKSSRPRPSSTSDAQLDEQSKRARIQATAIDSEEPANGSTGSIDDQVDGRDPGSSNPKVHMRGGVSASCHIVQGRKKAANSRVEAFARQLSGAVLAVRKRKANAIMKSLVASGTDQSTHPPDPSPTLEPVQRDDLPAGASSMTQLDQEGCMYALRCMNQDWSAGNAIFNRLKSCIELAMWLCRTSQFYGIRYPAAQAYERLFANKDLVTERQFIHWTRDGYTLLMLIYASSVYILPAIAVSSMNMLINRVLEEDRRIIENLLRDPSQGSGLPDSLLKLTELYIKNIHLDFNSCYGTVGIVLGGQRMGVNQAEDDAFIRQLLALRYPPYDFDMLPRGPIWSAPYSVITLPSSSLSNASVEVITAFNPKHPRNKQMPKALRQNAVEWTESERALAEAAECPATLEDFIKVKSLRRGWKKKGTYIRLPASFSLHTDILLYGVANNEEDLICYRLSDDTLTEDAKNLLYLRVLDFTKIGDQRVDSKTRPEGFKFKAVHVGWWNKMALTGKKCKGKQRAGKEHVRLRVAHITQSQPYYDRSAVDMEGDYDDSHFNHSSLVDFHDVLAESIAPIITKLKQRFPDLMGRHAQFSASLGPTYTMGCAPFCMAVLNIQPVTNGHRDMSDPVDSICLVLALGDFTGGELCLYAPGLVLELPHGSCVAIRSKRDIHFNLHFKGQRFSFVLTSDKCLKRWAEESNHWEELQPMDQGAQDEAQVDGSMEMTPGEPWEEEWESDLDDFEEEEEDKEDEEEDEEVEDED